MISHIPQSRKGTVFVRPRQVATQIDPGPCCGYMDAYSMDENVLTPLNPTSAACTRIARLATAIDPASARLGESLYTFVPRSVVGNLRDGVMMELERLRVRNIPLLSLQNKRALLPGLLMTFQRRKNLRRLT